MTSVPPVPRGFIIGQNVPISGPFQLWLEKLRVAALTTADGESEVSTAPFASYTWQENIPTITVGAAAYTSEAGGSLFADYAPQADLIPYAEY